MLIRKTQRGFTLVELLVAVAIFALLLGLGIPAYKEWMMRTQIRVMSETLISGLTTARNQALHRNTAVMFSLTTNLAADCRRNSGATNWVISEFDPENACSAAPSDTDAPRIIEKRSSGESGSRTKVSAVTATNTAASNVVFTGLGRVRAKDLAGNDAISIINVSYNGKSTDTCQKDGGYIRCLRIEITTGGEARMCDPVVADATDPRACTP